VKIRAEVISAKCIGERIEVVLQGSAEGESEHSGSMGVHTISLPAFKHIGRAFCVGRIVEIRIGPKSKP
jgi:hypothetical protein